MWSFRSFDPAFRGVGNQLQLVLCIAAILQHLLSFLEGKHLRREAQSGPICPHFEARVFLAFLCVTYLLDCQAKHLHILQVDESVLFLKSTVKSFLVILGPAFKHDV